MKITLEQLEALNPCEDGLAYWKEQGIEDLGEFMLQAHSDEHDNWSHWLFVRVVDAKTRVRYALYAARLVEHLADNVIVKKCNDTVERWLNDGASDDDLRSAADAAAYATSATSAAAYATSAADAAASAADSANAATSATYAANADYADYGDRKETHLKIIKYGIELLEELK